MGGTLSTGQKLVEAARELLDTGGESAVTLRAVAQAVGVSHNTPYRHFADRAALLAAVAERDFALLAQAFVSALGAERRPLKNLQSALATFVEYGETYPSRYRLLFSDPDIASGGGTLEAAAMQTFIAFEQLVEAAQAGGDLPATLPLAKLTGLIFATVHGLLDLQAGGRMRKEKGLSKASDGVDDLLLLLSHCME